MTHYSSRPSQKTPVTVAKNIDFDGEDKKTPLTVEKNPGPPPQKKPPTVAKNTFQQPARKTTIPVKNSVADAKNLKPKRNVTKLCVPQGRNVTEFANRKTGRNFIQQQASAKQKVGDLHCCCTAVDGSSSGSSSMSESSEKIRASLNTTRKVGFLEMCLQYGEMCPN